MSDPVDNPVESLHDQRLCGLADVIRFVDYGFLQIFLIKNFYINQ